MTHGPPQPDVPKTMPAPVPAQQVPALPAHVPTVSSPQGPYGASPQGHGAAPQGPYGASPQGHGAAPQAPYGAPPYAPQGLPTLGPGPMPPPGPDAPREPSALGVPRSLQDLKQLAMRYGRMLWWFHSFYALGLGISIILFAQKGFAHARWLSISLAGVWIVLIFFFRLYGSGKERTAVEGRREKLRFFVMTYVLKNLYQGMLFFLLPFYWRSATLDTPNQWFVLLLAACAALSTLDVVFDHILMRWKVAASIFYFVTLFACLNLVIPALLPDMRSLVTMTAAAVISALAFWIMHVPTRYLAKPAVVAGLVAWTVGALLAAYFGRTYVPPVAMYVAYGAVGPDLLSDGRLAVEAKRLHHSLIHDLHAITDVMVPGGKGDHLMHVWIHEGKEVDRELDLFARAEGPPGTVRLRSQLDSEALVDDPVGQWTIDVMTLDGQLVGRTEFEITE